MMLGSAKVGFSQKDPVLGMSIQDQVRERLISAVKKLFDIDISEFPVEVPPRTDLGDLAFPIAFDLAKRLKVSTGQKHNPRDIASKLAEDLQNIPGIARVNVAGAGYTNLFFDRTAYLKAALHGSKPQSPMPGGKIIVEHTALNPNKAAHIGHLRNAVLGDTVVRMLRAAGHQVEVQNYIDNTGVQVADVVVGFKYLEGKTLEQVKQIEGKFDYYCWDLYAKVGEFYEEDKTRLELRARTLYELESGTGETYELADYISTRTLNRHLDTMLRIDVEYDLLPRESEVLHLHLWAYAFELLKSRGTVVLETEGRLAGCWVMRAGEEEGISPEDQGAEHEADKVIVRSNGTVTYTGKDIAFHLWKLGQLDLDFYYKVFRTYPDGHLAWITTSKVDENNENHAEFGRGAAYFNVIDIGQSYPQHYVKLGVTSVDRDERVERSAHLAYERVVLSPAAVEELGQKLRDEDRDRTSISMSGRKGLGVKADDLIDKLESSARAEVASRHPGLDDEQKEGVAHRIAVGALRYFLLKYTRTSLISFDFKEALAFNGETGPYIQYAVVRANSIFRNLTEAGISASANDIQEIPEALLSELLSGEHGDSLWSLLYYASRLSEVVRSAIVQLEPAVIAKWTFQLAQNFNVFYHGHKVIAEPDPARRSLLVAVTAIVRDRLVEALELLGIEVPDRM
jgi:arginyl-tRNA synthetase